MAMDSLFYRATAGCDLYILSDDEIVDSETYCLTLIYNFDLTLGCSNFGKLIDRFPDSALTEMFGTNCNVVSEKLQSDYRKYVFMKVTTIFKPFNLLKL